MHVFIATPAYSGALSVEYVGALLAGMSELGSAGIVTTWRALPGLCYVDMARAELVRAFLETDATDLFFIDDDVGFPADGMIRLLRRDVDIIGGAYPKKTEDAQYPVRPLTEPDGRPVVDPETGLIECDGLPTGFLRIRRRVFETMVARFPDRAYQADGKTLYDLFPIERHSGQKWGEDFRFCQLARGCGFRVWCEPDIDFTHVGRRGWRGNYHEYLRALPGGGGPKPAHWRF